MRSIIWICLGLFFLAGCATIAPTSTPSTQITWNDRENALNKLQNWQMNGKIAVQTSQDSGSATINWTQNQQRFMISLLGPLGSNSLKLEGQPGRVTMETANGQHLTANSPEQLLSKQWGWNLPVSYLKYWVRGLPVPGIPATTQFDQYHRLSSLSQQGSTIQYLGYTNANGVELPQKIHIASAAIQTKIVIYEWNTHIAH